VQEWPIDTISVLQANESTELSCASRWHVHLQALNIFPNPSDCLSICLDVCASGRPSNCLVVKVMCERVFEVVPCRRTLLVHWKAELQDC
jgi:hypothetical protein